MTRCIQAADGFASCSRGRVRGSGQPGGGVAGRALAGGCGARVQTEFGLSERQGRRYVNAALVRPGGVVVPERTVVFTVRLAPSLIAGLRERARSGGVSLSAATAAAVGAYLEQAGERPGGQALEIEFVGDRLAEARLAQAYVILAPERRRVTHSERSDSERQQQRQRADDGAVGPGGRDLCEGVLGSSAARADDSESDRRAA